MLYRYIPIKYNTYDIYSVCIHIQLIMYTQHQIICAYTSKTNQTYIIFAVRLDAFLCWSLDS